MTAEGRGRPRDVPFLDAEEMSTLNALVDRIFPADELGPGARDLGVAAFIEAQMRTPWARGELMYSAEPFLLADHAGHGWQSPLAPRDVYRHGLAALDAYCRARFGGPLAGLAAADQDLAVAALRAGDVDPEPPPGAPPFFTLCRDNVLEGLLAHPRHGGNLDGGGWRWVGHPSGEIAR